MSEHPLTPDTSKTGRWYTARRLWSKLSRAAKFAGDKVLFTALILFYCLQDKDTPAWAKGVIVGALGYLILPVDLIPDAIPGVGYSDDWGALVGALGTVAAYIKDEHKEKARSQVDRLFGAKNQATPPPLPPEFS
ncbi:MAG: YkvA family protein [Luteolibacter sp.]